MIAQEHRVDKMLPAPELMAVQHLMPMSPEDRARLRDSIIEARRVRDPVTGYFDEDGIFRLLTGFNRWDISGELIREAPEVWGPLLSKIPIEVVEHQSRRDREIYAIRDNLDRRHPRQGPPPWTPTAHLPTCMCKR